MSPGKPDLSQCSVLHIKDFCSRGHTPKNKYLLVIGQSSESEVLAFLISSQLSYLQRESHKNEVVRLPANATSFLPFQSIIQCFELERLSISSLYDGFERGGVTNKGKLPVRYAHKIREVVKESRLLTQLDIDLALRVLPPEKSG